MRMRSSSLLSDLQLGEPPLARAVHPPTGRSRRRRHRLPRPTAAAAADGADDKRRPAADGQDVDQLGRVNEVRLARQVRVGRERRQDDVREHEQAGVQAD